MKPLKPLRPRYRGIRWLLICLGLGGMIGSPFWTILVIDKAGTYHGPMIAVGFFVLIGLPTLFFILRNAVDDWDDWRVYQKHGRQIIQLYNDQLLPLYQTMLDDLDKLQTKSKTPAAHSTKKAASHPLPDEALPHGKHFASGPTVKPAPQSTTVKKKVAPAPKPARRPAVQHSAAAATKRTVVLSPRHQNKTTTKLKRPTETFVPRHKTEAVTKSKSVQVIKPPVEAKRKRSVVTPPHRKSAVTQTADNPISRMKRNANRDSKDLADPDIGDK